MDRLKQWKCDNGHVLGVVQRVRVDGFHVSRLMLFRHAINLDVDGKMEDVDVIAIIEGSTLDAACDVENCGAKRTWHMGKDVVKKVKAMYVAE